MQSRGFYQRCVESHVGSLDLSRFESAILGSGHTFSTANDFRDAIYLISVGDRFRYKFKRNCLKHSTVICVVKGCPWKVTALVRCNQATTMIDDVICSNLDYLPRQICKDFRRQYEKQLNYCQAWNLKEKAKERTHGVPQWTIVEYKCLDDGHFMQLFVVLSVSIHGFKMECRPIISIDSSHMSGPYKVASFSLLRMMLTMACFHLLMAYLALRIMRIDFEVIIISYKHQGIICSVSEKTCTCKAWKMSEFHVITLVQLSDEWGLMYLIMLMTSISTIYGTVHDALGHTYPFLNPPTTKRPPRRPRKRVKSSLNSCKKKGSLFSL
ncbi:hypothetical protein AAG906_004484 [Vitis piasezkii]